MCEPWGSFLVDNRGKIYAKDGVLSHSALMQEFGLRGEEEWKPIILTTTHDRLGNPITVTVPPLKPAAKRFFQPEFNWIHRRLDDLNRHDLEETAGSRACDAIDDFVDRNFAKPDRFFKWLERGNYLGDKLTSDYHAPYVRDYANLFNTHLPDMYKVFFDKAKRIRVKGCQHSIVFQRELNEATHVMTITGRCKDGCVPAHQEISKQLMMDYGSDVIIPYATKKLELRMRKKGFHYAVIPSKLKDRVPFSAFADLWKKPENRIPVWQLN